MDQLVRDILGYLNFSSGKPDTKFQRNLNDLMHSAAVVSDLNIVLTNAVESLDGTEPTFADVTQAREVIRLTLDETFPAYIRHHGDILFHLEPLELDQPFLLAKMFEAVVAQGGPWNETERVVDGALEKLNDFLGYRPLAVLENEQQMEPYDHERYRPIPLFVRDAGVANGPYKELIEHTLKYLGNTPDDLLAEAWFSLDNLDELSLDLRAHDHAHPVNKRTNYMFGEWDPHQIDTKGFYRRFVVRRIILDALLVWLESHTELPREERLADAATVLSGTILMASSISGAGPQTYDSTISLSSLLPRVARQRDAFYLRWINSATGERRERLKHQAELTRQPFGHVRQELNMYVARYGARQVQHRHLAWLYARMGYEEAAREEATVIPALSARFETELQLLLTSANRQLKTGDVGRASDMLKEVEDLFDRGIKCGALVDPWNILAFQGHFPLFAAREDAIPDNRVEILMDLMEQTFGAYSRAVGEAAAQGDLQLRGKLSTRFEALASRWDRYATVAVEDLPHVAGHETWESSVQVANALQQWQSAGSSAGDIKFWSEHIQNFQSPQAYALVVEALLDKKDHIAAMGLMMQWLSDAETTGLESGPHAVHPLLVRWMELVTGDESLEGEMWPTVRRMFDYLEANAGEYWNAPTLREYSQLNGRSTDEELPPRPPEGDFDPFLGDEESTDEKENLFSAAYDEVVFRDSADDGQVGETHEGGYAPGTTEFEILNRQLEPRLAFLQTLFRLWQMAAAALASREESLDELSDTDVQAIRGWQRSTANLQAGLVSLLKEVWAHEITSNTGDLDQNIEYDIQLQSRYMMLHAIIATTISCVQAQRLLGCLLPADKDDTAQDTSTTERKVSALYRSIVRRDRRAVRRQLPQLLSSIAERPLLYVPFENGGQPQRVLRAKSLQALIRFLLAQLPRMGLIRETLDVLRAAFRMERTSRPAGFAVTEFDRLFRIGLENSLTCLVHSWTEKKSGDDPKQLTEYTLELVEHYAHLWGLHSSTMRLSTIEELRNEELADEIREFIEEYGADLFHTRMLTLGNIRTVLHQGLDSFLDFLEEESDPLHPMKLIEDIQEGRIDAQDSMDNIEIVYEAVIDRFDRFLEYNTTTTQSDYGEKFYCFLDFLRVECAYDRDAWTLTPMRIAHEALVRNDQHEAALMWEQDMRSKTSEMAEGHLTELSRLEVSLGMRLPSLRDRVSERFVKPLVVNRILALVPPALADASEGRLDSPSFAALRVEVAAYLDDTFGSGIDVPQWLQVLEHEITRVERSSTPAGPRREDHMLDLAPMTTRFSELIRQLELLAEPEPDQPAQVPSRRRRRRRDRQDPDKK
jgi:hypothetical protein